jgi:hypothetical protein
MMDKQAVMISIRPKWCELIDGDELYKRYWHEERLLDKPYIDYLGILAVETPTIIEAEGE